MVVNFAKVDWLDLFYDEVFKQSFVLRYCPCIIYTFIEHTRHFLFSYFAGTVRKKFSNASFFKFENFQFKLVLPDKSLLEIFFGKFG